MSTTTTFATAQQYQQQRQQQQKQLSRLCQAVLDGDSALVREYCELGDDVDEATGPLERTPLHLACRNNDLELARYLLEVAGARADPVSGDGLQALHIAVSHGNRRMVELLLLRQSTGGGGLGLSPPVKFMDRSPLYMAVDHDCYGIAEALLEAGARIDESRAGSCSLINLALRKGPAASRKWLALLTSYDCGGDDLDLVDAHELKTPLIRSIEEQDVALVSKLLSKGASPNLEAFSVEGYMSPLNLATHLGNEELASLLLEHGARTGANEALRHAAMHGKLGLVEMLLGRARADPASVNLDGCTALHLAVINEQPETVRALLRHQNGGPSAPSRSSNQQIPVLYCAVKTGRCDIVEMLLEHGYPVNEYVCQKITCLDYAIKTRSAAVIDTLMRHGAVFSSCSSLEKSFAVKNLALLRAQGGLKLGKEHRRRIAAHRELGRLFERCQRELEAMKVERIVQDDQTKTTTFYELLIANDDDQLMDMVRRCSASFPSVEECRERFPEYCDALLGNYERGRSRDELLGRAAEDFESTVVGPKLASSRSSSISSGGSDCGGGEQQRATIAAVRRIVSLLTDEDLRNLCLALGGRPPRQAAAEEEMDGVDDPARDDVDQQHRKDFIMNRSDQSIAAA
ncbi:hypothetical protein TKK_0007061 [Trichogramma kaykai]|uniref:ANK_REP_REGION domain-containing protein n=1 Tax=Trichogramma kaykai TaxID=54128 RepID=A0ABD2XA28_9HYME